MGTPKSTILFRALIFVSSLLFEPPLQCGEREGESSLLLHDYTAWVLVNKSNGGGSGNLSVCRVAVVVNIPTAAAAGAELLVWL